MKQILIPGYERRKNKTRKLKKEGGNFLTLNIFI